MKILMILPQAYFEYKGTSFSTLNRLKVLADLGHEIDLLTYPVGRDIDLNNVKTYRIPNILLVKKVKIGPSWIKLVFDIVLVIYAVKMMICRKYDLIHSHEEASFFSNWLAKIFGKYHIYDMHSSLPQQLINTQFTKSKILIKIFSFLERITINGADAIIAICPALYHWVKKINPEANAYLIENVMDYSPDDGKVKINPDSLKQKYCLHDKRVILYAGTFETYQGIDLFLDGANIVTERHQNAHFLLVGGRVDQVSYYQNKVKQKNLSDYFTFTGSVAPNDIESFYQLADILVTPRLEGTNTPLKIYAYLRSGKPIVATRHITHTQVLNDNVAMLTDVTPQAFAQGINRILENEELGKQLSVEAMKLADERYSARYYIQQIKSLFNSLTNGNESCF